MTTGRINQIASATCEEAARGRSSPPAHSVPLLFGSPPVRDPRVKPRTDGADLPTNNIPGALFGWAVPSERPVPSFATCGLVASAGLPGPCRRLDRVPDATEPEFPDYRTDTVVARVYSRCSIGRALSRQTTGGLSGCPAESDDVYWISTLFEP